jgi:hypothetical protein
VPTGRPWPPIRRTQRLRASLSCAGGGLCLFQRPSAGRWGYRKGNPTGGCGIASWVDFPETWRPTAGLTSAIAGHGSRDSVDPRPIESAVESVEEGEAGQVDGVFNRDRLPGSQAMPRHGGPFQRRPDGHLSAYGSHAPRAPVHARIHRDAVRAPSPRPVRSLRRPSRRRVTPRWADVGLATDAPGGVNGPRRGGCQPACAP